MLVSIKKFWFLIRRVFSDIVFLNLSIMSVVAWFVIGHDHMCDIVSSALWHLGQVEL
jgi:hypothetical protein